PIAAQLYKPLKRAGKPSPHGGRVEHRKGDWFGNDTIWRTVLDLNKIIRYADKSGRMHPVEQRRLFHLVDGIVAGEAEGPLSPTPKPCGLLVGGFDPVAVDSICARLMGFDEMQIPMIRN
ncbi:MAG: DUF362 domain-containing protein, partial [Candidatus Marsarchaeota archaeon]|nr:DUF362 domain-containing protein [Candidatus Marsarchaeota archaeon]